MARPCSPDSSISISSLLASCSVRSSRSSSGTSIEYKERLYDSASDALEAYIQDYEAGLSGGREPKASQKSSFGRVRVGSGDPDLLSLTTDDLLGFPSDGSLPFTQALKQWKDLRNHRGASRQPWPPPDSCQPWPPPDSHQPWSPPASPSRPASSSRINGRPLGHSFHPEDLRDLTNLLQEQKRRAPTRESRPAHHPPSPYLPGASKSYPRWLTNHKSQLAVSGITSVPDVGYPLWLEDYGLLGGSSRATERPRSIDADPSLFASADYKDGDGRVNDAGDTLPPDLHMVAHLHKLLKSFSVESAPPQSRDFVFSRSPDVKGSPRTEDVLEEERSWERIHYSLKSPVPVSCEEEAMKGSEEKHFPKDAKNASFSGGNHHGPVEALKHMLYNLQAFQQNFPRGDPCEQAKEAPKVYMEADTDLQRVESEETFPVNKSLQKALQHLSRLKELVGDGATLRPDQAKKEGNTEMSDQPNANPSHAGEASNTVVTASYRNLGQEQDAAIQIIKKGNGNAITVWQEYE
ncbi:lung adenoma susceptibility protein 2 [Gastrophryne carolinensis]